MSKHSFYLTRVLFFLVTILEFLKPVHSVSGMIWDKKMGEFTPLFSNPIYADMNDQILKQSRREETYNFQGEIIKFSFYEEMNIINSHDNGTKITGAIGEIWNILSEFLNFTLKPIQSRERSLGFANINGMYDTGLLSIVQRNGTDVVPRVEAHSSRLAAAQLTIPFWHTSYRLYIRREVRHLPTWMLKLFSRKVWEAILVTHLILSVCSYVSQIINFKFMRATSKATLTDHLFYNFGMICGQGYLPNAVSRSSRIVELWLGLFSSLIRTAFGALLLGYMTQTISVPPFHDLHSLLDQTSYNIFTLKGSLPSLIFEIREVHVYNKAVKNKRHVIAYTMEEMYKKTCMSDKLYAIYQSEDIKKARGLYVCPLNPVGISILDAWIVSALSWKFKYKRTIDMGILKLYEVGFIKLLKQRWIEAKNAEDEVPNAAEAIVMEQVYLILAVFTVGLCISFILLLFENITFYCKNS